VRFERRFSMASEDGPEDSRAKPLLRGAFRKKVDYSNLNRRPQEGAAPVSRSTAPGNSHCTPTGGNGNCSPSWPLGDQRFAFALPLGARTSGHSGALR